MISDRLHDVIVVGGGPAGSACAAVLARNGLEVLLIDRARFPREKICGDCLNPRSWEILEAIGAAEAVRNAPHRRITGVRIASWRGRSAHGFVPGRFREPFLAIRRTVLDQILLDNARTAGATILEETQVLGVDSGQTIRVQTGGSNGQSTFTCRYLVGADGRNSIVAATSRARVQKSRRRDRIGLQWFAPLQPLLDNEVLLLLLPHGYAGIVNVDEESANVALSVDPRRVPRDHRALPALLMESLQSQEVLRNLTNDLSPLSKILTAFPIQPRENFSLHPRILLAGDARQTAEPFTGEGITFALCDGVETASTILGSEGRRFHKGGRSRNDFWVNRVYSPLLRHPGLLDAGLRNSVVSSRLLSAAMRTVFR